MTTDIPQALKDRPSEFESTYDKAMMSPMRERLVDDTIHACVVKLMGMGILQYGTKGWEINEKRLVDYGHKQLRGRKRKVGGYRINRFQRGVAHG